MKKLKGLLFLEALFTIVSTPTYPAHFEIQLPHNDATDVKPRDVTDTPNKPTSLLQRFKNFRFKDLMARLGKKLDATKKVPQSSSPVEIQIDTHTQLDGSELKKIEELVATKKSTFQNEQDRTKPLTQEQIGRLQSLRMVLERMAQQQRTINDAITRITNQEEDLLTLKRAFEEAKQRYLEVIVKKDNPTQNQLIQEAGKNLKTAQDALLKEINKALNKQITASLENQEELIVQKLTQNKISSMDDTDDYVKIYYEYWNRAKSQLLEADTRATNSDQLDVLKERLTIDAEKIKALNQYVENIITGIERTTSSLASKRNWKKFEEFDTELETAKNEAQNLSDTWNGMQNEQKESAAGKSFKELYTKLQTMKAQDINFFEKGTLLKNRSLFSFKQPEGSLKRMIADLKTYLKEMKTTQ